MWCAPKSGLMRTLLLIEDSPVQRAAIREPLAATKLFDTIYEAEDGAEGLRLLMTRPYSMVVCDVEMPTLDGEKLLHTARQQPGGGPPFLMLTAVREPRRRAALLRNGARDVITKPFDPLELIARVELHLEVARLQCELAEKNTWLAELASTDGLTELPNRRKLTEAIALEWKRAARYRNPLSVVIADIDHFKRVNDEHGHPVGDLVLREVAGAIRGQVRAADIAGRWGGEEFLGVLTAPLQGAIAAAEKWRCAVKSMSLDVAGRGALRVTISLGVASRTAQMRDAEELIVAADAALYAAKRAGRDRTSASTG
jgi:two-component system cell cycle response regulator